MENASKDCERVNLDTIFIKEVGQFGRFQLRVATLAAVVVVFIGWSTSEYLFTTARINTRCRVPECEDKYTTIFLPSWISNAIPESGGSFDNCNRFAPLNTSTSINNECPREIFGQEETIPCDDFVYENTHSIVYDFDLACDEWRRTLIGSMRTLGTLASLPIVGFISDRWGRRAAIVFCSVNAAWLGLFRYIANTYTGFLISEVIESTFGSGGFSSSYILMMEITSPKYRVVAGALMNTFFAIGQVTTGFIAWAVPNWRTLTLVLYAPQLLTIAYYWLLPESPRWYIGKGRYYEAEKLLQIAARVNNKSLSQKSLQSLRNHAEEEKNLKVLQELQRSQEPLLIVQVFRHKRILLRVLVSPIWWITMTFVYYGLSINSVNMVGNRYLNFVLVSAVEIPGYWASTFLMGRIGRKPVMIGAYWICALCQFGYIFVPGGMYGVSLTLYLIGKCSISMVLTSLYVYTAELYPTKHRHSLFAFSSMIGRIGSIVAPLTPALASVVWEKLPFILFGGFALLSGFLVMLTPETLGTKLPDTMEDASAIGRK